MSNSETRKYEILLAMIISARATSFIFSKMILQSMGAFNLLAIRFIIAFLLLILIFHKKMKNMTGRTFRAGVVIGVLFFMVMSLEMLALKDAASSLVSLLENCAIIFVPLLEILLCKKIPSKMIMLSTIVAMIGVILLAIHQGNLRGGFTYGLLAGLVYGMAIIVTQKLTYLSDSTLNIGIIQVGTMGIMSLLATVIFEQPQLPQTGAQWSMILGLIIVCTGFGFTLQPVAQSHVTAERAGIFCALSPAIASLLGIVVLHERLGVIGFVGLILILLSIIFPYVKGIAMQHS